ncbi:MAG: hypothetical protein ABS58_12315 [Mesorhizobium sp. SCN 65-20]|nr:MAG: hypothetical protein ABS58_12315 [Mesorhizobium sp. SCN 65-20]
MVADKMTVSLRFVCEQAALARLVRPHFPASVFLLLVCSQRFRWLKKTARVSDESPGCLYVTTSVD